jgi:serine/threonine protein kinase
MSKTYQTISSFQQDYQYDLSDEESFLGEGTYGQVIKAYDDTNHRFVALKIGKDLMAEFEATKNLEHRNIAKYEACYRIPDKNTGVKDYAIMQLYPEGNLSQLLKNKTLTIEQKKEIAKGILEGLKYLHSQGRIHRDLKPANILIVKKQNEYIPLISDFGLTKVVKENDYVDGSDVQLSDGKGTPSYKAPEQIEGEKAHYNLDLWAFGVILYEMLLGERPFTIGRTGNESQRFNELLRQIKEVVIPDKINTIPEPYQAMIRKCLVKDIHKRVRRANELIDMLGERKEKGTDKAYDLGTDEQKKENKNNLIFSKIPRIADRFFAFFLGVVLHFPFNIMFDKTDFYSRAGALAGISLFFTSFYFIYLVKEDYISRKKNLIIELLILSFFVPIGHIYTAIIFNGDVDVGSIDLLRVLEFVIVFLFLEGVPSLLLILGYFRYQTSKTGKKYLI